MDILEEKVSKLLKENERNKSRWISLKIIDGNEKILKSIEENFNINLNDKELLEKKLKVMHIIYPSISKIQN